MHLQTNRIVQLNETGARIWELLCAGATTETIAAALIEEFHVDDPTARAGIDGLVAQLRDEALIE